MPHNRILPPTYVLIALIAMLALHVLVPIVQVIPTPWTLLGLLPLIAGIVINVMADNRFHQVGTTIKPGEASTVLVTTGLFRLTRNPMYLGFVLILTGVAILLGSLAPFVVIPVFATVIDRLFITMEEQMLRTSFGAQWQAYAKQTRRWL